MIEAKIKDGATELQISGTLPDLVADTATLISAVYSALQEKSVLAANLYRDRVTKSLDIAFMLADANNSPEGEKAVSELANKLRELDSMLKEKE